AFYFFIDNTQILGQWSYKLFVSVHDYSGLTWGYTIPITCVMLRFLITFPVAIWSRKNMQRSSTLSPMLKSSTLVAAEGVRREKLKILPKEGTDAELVPIPQFAKELGMHLQKSYSTNIFKSLSVAFVQAFALLFGSRGVFHYANLRTEETEVLSEGTFFHNQGFLWFTDLDKPDPYLVIPLSLAILSFYNIERYWKEAAAARAFIEGKRTLLSAILNQLGRLGVLSLVTFSFSYSTSFTLYWLTSALCTTAQQAFLRRYYRLVPSPELAKPLKKMTDAKVISAKLNPSVLRDLISRS
ncbi:60Kd inner membrane protein-domain-containing protein, partial [Dipodascopsis uninucleata]